MSSLPFKSVRAHKSELGIAVFARDRWSNSLPIMLGSEPVVDSTFRVESLLCYCQALELAMQCIEDHAREIKPTPALSDALNELQKLQWRFEAMAEDARQMHAAVVEHISCSQPEMMQDYLSAFTKAVGQGDV